MSCLHYCNSFITCLLNSTLAPSQSTTSVGRKKLLKKKSDHPSVLNLTIIPHLT